MSTQTLTVHSRRTCFACPSQWDVSCGEHTWYVRYRSGYFAIHQATALGRVLYEWESDDGFDGWMSDETMQEHFWAAGLLSKTLPWEFSGWQA